MSVHGFRFEGCRRLVLVAGLLAWGCAEVDYHRDKDGTYHYGNEQEAAEKQVENFDNAASDVRSLIGLIGK